jgi:hypothetical protein
MHRREFLMGTAACVAGIAGARAGWAQGAAPARARQATLDRIAIMTLNFQSILRVPDVESNPNRTLELFDLPQMLADRYGVHKVEFQHYHLASTEPSYLKEMRGWLEKSKSRATQINLEFGALNMSAPRQRDRVLAIDLTKMWVEHAVLLGAQRVMINQGEPTHDNKAYGIPTLKTMVDYGRSRKIIVSVETRGGGGGGRGRGGGTAPGTASGAAPAAGAAAPAGAPPAAAQAAAAPEPPRLTGPARWMLLAELIKGAGAYSNVDVGGAGAANQEELHACLKTMFPMTANSMHTRVNTNWDLATAIKYLENDLGYKGLYTIETGNGHEGTQQIYDVTVATLESLAPQKRTV